MDSVSKLLKDLLGPKGWITDDCLAWQRDWLDSYGESPLGVARPKSTIEIQDLMKICYKQNNKLAKLMTCVYLGKQMLLHEANI